MQLTEHFTLEELTRSATAERLQIDNTPDVEQTCRLVALACELEGVRRVFGRPIIVTSGFRCPELNKAVGGKPTSQHTRGEAADIQPIDPAQINKLYKVCILYDFDQVLLETKKDGTKWIHVSKKPVGNRHQFIDNYKA